MRRTSLLLAIASIGMSIGGCATVVRGTNTTWQVNTMPGGASVQTSSGLTCPATPCSLVVPRKYAFAATITKPGYQPVSMQVSPSVSTSGAVAFVGNAVIGGLIGAGVDLYTGAIYDLDPNNTVLTLLQQPYGTTTTSSVPEVPLTGYWQQPPTQTSVEPKTSASIIQASADVERYGHVVMIKVLPGGAIQEVREYP